MRSATPPAEAAGPGRWDSHIEALAPFVLSSGRVVVVSAHPDDETLGAGGLMRVLHRQGATLELVVASDGEAAFPSLGVSERSEVGRRRRKELTDATRRLGLAGVTVTWLGQPDSGLDRSQLRQALEPLLEGADLCLAPWPNDPHPDHRCAGLAARDACAPSTELWCYPIWTWVWQTPAQARLPWEYGRVHRLDDSDLRAKQHAIEAFGSQIEPAPDGGDAVLAPSARRMLETHREVFFPLPGRRTTPLARFETLYDADPDPWRTAGDPYERRKRAVTLAALPKEHYGQCLDAGAGSGELTVELASRCDRVLAIDAVPAAVARCRDVTTGLDHVSVEVCRLPSEWPDGRWDLLVFSELLYYFDHHDLDATLDRAEATAPPGSHLLAVDWRPITPDAPRDADDAHGQMLDRPGWRVLVEHIEEDFVLHVLERR